MSDFLAFWGTYILIFGVGLGMLVIGWHAILTLARSYLLQAYHMANKGACAVTHYWGVLEQLRERYGVAEGVEQGAKKARMGVGGCAESQYHDITS